MFAMHALRIINYLSLIKGCQTNCKTCHTFLLGLGHELAPFIHFLGSCFCKMKGCSHILLKGVKWPKTLIVSNWQLLQLLRYDKSFVLRKSIISI